MMIPADDVTLTVDECAEWVGKSRATIYRWIASGDLPMAEGTLVRMSALLRVEREKRVATRRAHLTRKLTA